MKILLLDNAALVYRNGHFCCAEGTGNFAKELISAGNDVLMLGQKVNNVSNVSTFKIEENGIKVAGIWKRKNRLINYLLMYLYSIYFLLKSDFIYIFYPNTMSYLAVLCILLRKKYGLYVRGEEDIYNSHSKYLYRNAYGIFTVSHLFTQQINCIAKKQVAKTIRPMVKFTDEDIVKNRNYYVKEEYNILFLCRISEQKGLGELIKALSLVHSKTDYKFYLNIVGDGDYVECAKRIVKEFGLNDYIKFCGSVNEPDIMRYYYLNSDLYVLPTYYKEGFPRTLYEAMIFGTPIITTLVAGIPGLMEDGYNCKSVKEKSVDDLFNALVFAMKNYEKMGEYARNAINTVRPIVDKHRLSHAEDVNLLISKI